ncbi:exopolysaccharide biosynthesis protein [Brevundimonas sp.]|uniref:exopolysaccharide biosynthesis protein n=1 Tax=Brevundimonas sp. TaxID=1871086 RepID=UPI0025B9ADE5|nr:exopolysaccharide biosynthesis protein [Brevundimonas sp.]
MSDVLETLALGPAPRLTMGEVVHAFGERGFGALILIFALVSLFPWPPGSKAILSVPIILLSLELAFQRERVWLPGWTLNRGLPRRAFGQALSRVLKPIRFVERLSRPRMPWLTGEVADVVTGLTCVFLAVMMALPVPFGDLLPGVTLIVLGLGIMQRDGAAILLGAVGTVVCVIYLFLVWTAVTVAVAAIGGWAGRLF